MKTEPNINLSLTLFLYNYRKHFNISKELKMRISLLAVILALLFVACHETKKQILQNEADSTPSEKTIWQPEQK